MPKAIVKALVDGGKASAGPPLGPSLAPLKVNIGQVISAINEKTKEFSGVQVPVEIIVNEDKTFSIKVGTPPVSSLVKKELKVDKLARAPFGTYVPKEGESVIPFDKSINLEQLVKIAHAKQDVLGTKNFKKAVKQIVASCVSTGVKVEGKNPKEILKEIDNGVWDSKINA